MKLISSLSCTKSQSALRQALVAEADAHAAPTASSSGEVDAGDIQAVAEAVAGYVASQYATEAVRCI